MYSLTVENHRGERLRLTQNPNYAVIDIDGLNPPKANVNVGENANFDGATFMSSRLNTRNIVVSIVPLNNVEKNRIALYQYFNAKKECTLYFSNGKRSVYIKGYVNNFAFDLFSKNGSDYETIQVSIICPDPYFRDINQTQFVFSHVIDMFEFEMDIPEDGVVLSAESGTAQNIVMNEGDVETGFLLRVHVNGNASAPTIENRTTGEKLKIYGDYSGRYNAGDEIYISTVKGNKYAYEFHNGKRRDLLNNIDWYLSTWVSLDIGINNMLFSAAVGEDNFDAVIEYDNLYEGV